MIIRILNSQIYSTRSLCVQNFYRNKEFSFQRILRRTLFALEIAPMRKFEHPFPRSNLQIYITRSWKRIVAPSFNPLLMIETSHCVIKTFENTRDTIPTVYSNVAPNPFHPTGAFPSANVRQRVRKMGITNCSDLWLWARPVPRNGREIDFLSVSE